MLLFFDIETFSDDGFRADNTKVISIQYRDYDGKYTMLKEWESSEKDILQRFLTELKMMKRDNFLILVGHNILRFDLPTLIRRMVANGVDGLGNLEDFFYNIAMVDTLQCALPFNGMRFKGLNTEDLARNLKITEPHHKNTEIDKFYRNKEFTKIEQHAVADIDFVQDIYWKLKNREVPQLPNENGNGNGNGFPKKFQRA